MVGTSHGRRRFATLFGVGLTLAATVQVSTAHLQTASAATDEDVNYRVDAAQTGAQTNDNLTPPLEKRWLKSFVGGQVSYPLIAGGRVFVTVANGPIGDQSGTKLYALDATSGTELWHAAVGGNNSEFAAAAYEGGRVYVVNADGRVRAYDGASGLLAWVRDTNLRVFAPPTASGGSVYIYGYDAYYSMARVIAIGEAHGDIRWSAVGSLLSGDFGDVVVSPTGVFVSSACEQTYAFDPASGAQLWHYATGCFGGGGLPAALYDGKLYVRDSFRGYPPAILDPATGAKLGTFSSLSAPAFSGGTGFFDAPPTSAGPHEVQATDLTSGLPNWVFSGDGHLVTDPLVVGGLVFTGSAQGNLYALDNRTGAMVWSTNVGNPINGFNPGEWWIQSGLGAGEGMVLVPATNTLTAFAPGSSGAATGTVTNAAGGAPIAGATVSDNGGASITTNGSGLYALGGLAPGIHQLTAAASGFASGTRTVSIVAGTTTSSVDFSLTRTASVPRFVQAAGAAETIASTSLTGTFATSTSTGHLLVLSASVYTGTTNRITSVSDSAGNTWTRIAAFYTAGHNSDGEMWYAANARPVTSVTVHTGAAALVALAVQEFSGVSTTLPPDGFAGTTKLSTSPSSGSVTPTAANDVEVGFVAGHANSEPISVTAAGYSTQAQQTSTKSSSTSASLITGYKVLTSASPSTFSGNFPSAMYWAAGIVSFKAGP